jgi:hypothetical protein
MAVEDDVRRRIGRRAQLLCIWCGPVMLVSVLVGLVVVAGYIPGPHPTASAAAIKDQYVDNLGGIRAGLILFTGGIALLVPWGAAIVSQTRRIDLGTPVLTQTQTISVAVATMIGLLAGIAWAVAAFRPAGISPETTRAFNDLGWVFFIFDWSPFAVWYLAVGLQIMMDPSDAPIFPRWSGWLSIWTAVLSVPGGAMLFFKTGPLAFNGLLGLYIPLAVFFIWIVTFTVLARRAINREAAPEKASAERQLVPA